jgi:thioredoxin reductase (NADPH)
MTQQRGSQPATPPDHAVREVDCVIVGGGAAGLSAAINMGRMMRSVLIVDDKDRFRWRHRIHNYLGFPEGLEAGELRRIGRRQAALYGATFAIGNVTQAERDGDGFRFRIDALTPYPGFTPETWAATADPEITATSEVVAAGKPIHVRARSVILAMGVRGHFPDFKGRDDCVGISLFWCLHCDGYESRDKVVAVVGHDEEAIETALDVLDFTSRVTIVAGRAEGFSVPESRLRDLDAAGIPHHSCAVAEYSNSDGQFSELVLADAAGTRLPVEHVYTVVHSVPWNSIALQLGVEVNDIGHIVVNTSQETNVIGVYAAGDVTSPHDHQFSAAVHEGNQAACAANYHLYRPEQKAPADANGSGPARSEWTGRPSPGVMSLRGYPRCSRGT